MQATETLVHAEEQLIALIETEFPEADMHIDHGVHTAWFDIMLGNVRVTVEYHTTRGWGISRMVGDEAYGEKHDFVFNDWPDAEKKIQEILRN